MRVLKFKDILNEGGGAAEGRKREKDRGSLVEKSLTIPGVNKSNGFSFR